MGSLRPAVGRFPRARIRLAAGLGALALTLLVGAPAAYAATITVNTTADELNADGDCSLREAIEAANTNTAVDACPAGNPGPVVDEIRFGVTGTITLGFLGQLSVTDDATIAGPGAATLTVSGNHTTRVMHVADGVTAEVRGVTIADGRFVSAPTLAGAGILNFGTLTVADSVLSGNDGGGSCCSGLPGGAIASSGGILTVTGSTFSGNAGGGPGGGIYSEDGTLTVTGSTFSGNSSNEWGGGFFNVRGTANVTDTTFSGNTATFGGGAIFNFPEGILTVDNTTFAGNSTGAASGGAIANYVGSIAVTNATFSQNTAEWDGGGIHNYEGTAVVTAATFSGNTVVRGAGGGLWNAPWTSPTSFTLKGTIVANSPSGGNCFGPIADGGDNLSWPDTTCPGINVDPLLDPAGLQDNGGPTETVALQPGSPAIDAAVACPPPSTDQRGVLRPRGAACDIGAFELDTVRVAQHFLRYQLDQPEALGETVTLVDRFGTMTVRIEEAEWLLNPAEKRRQGRDPEPIQRGDEHLVCYGLPYMTTADRSVAVENQFVHSTLRVGRPLALCTPASKAATGDPGPPPDDLDHFVCYDVRGESPLFPSETLVAQDQFGQRTIRIDRARELCNPAEKRRTGHDPEPVLRPEEHLVCYRITTQTPAFAALRVVANDQFHSLQTLRVRTLERLCVPSTAA